MIVAGEGRLLLAGDYSQLELRILSHCSGDSQLRQLVSVADDGTDPFIHIAAKVLETDHVTPERREEAKQVNHIIC